MKKLVLHVLLPLLFLGGAAGGARHLMSTAKTTEPKPTKAAVPLVTVVSVAPFEGSTTLVGNGVVEPEREARLAAEISGKLTYVSERLVEGAVIPAGEVLVKIDGSAYKVAVKQQQAQVRQAELTLEMERSAADAAKREWEVSGQEPPENGRRIALRQPQVEVAQASIDAAKSAVTNAKLNLRRTTIRAPFNAAVTSETVEKGDVVSPGMVMATLVGVDRFLARVSLPVEQLALLEMPGADDSLGSAVTVEQTLAAGTKVVRRGHVLRLLTKLDGQSRTAQVLVAIDKPLDPGDGDLPLLVGSFVSAKIEGRPIGGALAVPRTALFGGNRVWTVDAEDTLRERELAVVFGNDEQVIVTGGLAVGDRIVVSRIPVATEGMKVRINAATDEESDA